tara:strand:+ start:449 stop:751 length:303 start_codon:yes stop_codon:yes gene_type:complete
VVPKKEDVAVPKVVEVKVDPEVEVTQATVVIQVTAVTQVIPVDLLPQEDATTMATIPPTTMAAMATIKAIKAIHQDDQDGVHHHQVHNHPDHQIKMDHHR